MKVIACVLTLFLVINIISSYAEEVDTLLHNGAIRSVTFSLAGPKLLASAGDDMVIKLYDLQDGAITTLEGHSDRVTAIVFSPNGRLLASGANDRRCRIWDIASQSTIITLKHIVDRSIYQIQDVAFSPDGRLLATAAKSVKLWDTTSWQEIAVFRTDAWIRSVAFSHDGQLLAVGDRSGHVRVWNVDTGQVVVEIKTDTTGVYSVAFSPDNTVLASGGSEAKIKLFSTVNWEPRGTLQNFGAVFDLAFTPDSKTLASTGYKRISLWSIESGKNIVEFKEHTGWVRSIALSPDGTTVASGGDDGVVRTQRIDAYLQQESLKDIVRLIYFVPNDRVAQEDMDELLDTMIKEVQQFYADQMQCHGYGQKTFRFETDADGKAIVHHINGKLAEADYRSLTIEEEVGEYFNLSSNIYSIFIEGDPNIIHLCGLGSSHRGGISGRTFISTLKPPCFYPFVATHELGHAFGLQHDFRKHIYVMSYGRDGGWEDIILSKCAAEWLNASRYFNPGQHYFDNPTSVQILPPRACPSDAIMIRFDLTDTDLLHQAQLIISATAEDPVGGIKLYECKSLDNESSEISFMMSESTAISSDEIQLQVIDINGNITIEIYESNDVLGVQEYISPLQPEDVNADGTINIFDLVLVASYFETTNSSKDISKVDINKDGVVNINDLILIAKTIKE